jgi:hypothetical protein
MGAVMVIAAIVARVGLRPGIHVADDRNGESAPADSVAAGEAGPHQPAEPRQQI